MIVFRIGRIRFTFNVMIAALTVAAAFIINEIFDTGFWWALVIVGAIDMVFGTARSMEK